MSTLTAAARLIRDLLEPCAGKLASTVLRGRVGGNARPVTRHYEGFEGAKVGEYYSFANVVELADYIRERGELGAQVLNYYGGNIKDAKAGLMNMRENMTA